MLSADLFSSGVDANAAAFPLRLDGAEVEYIPAFADQILAAQWFDALMQDGAVAWRRDHIMMYGREVPIPRLNAWYGDPGLAYTYSGIPMNPEPWSALLSEICDRVERVVNHRFTSALINLYRDHRDSVAWHADDEPELGPEPVIASLSLGAPREFQMRHRQYRKNGLKVFKIKLEPGSLLVMRGPTQKNWLHQIPKRSLGAVSGPRINITFRKIVAV